ncbi:hypothetical protein BaRGS_00001872 [Batillaria attramentaria]|uniref:Uncharacterized protein n=1 Tax=Batillaria attramentaria TaxID=370345 RepID=A0ABD0M6G3_9CAEN
MISFSLSLSLALKLSAIHFTPRLKTFVPGSAASPIAAFFISRFTKSANFVCAADQNSPQGPLASLVFSQGQPSLCLSQTDSSCVACVGDPRAVVFWANHMDNCSCSDWLQIFCPLPILTAT